MKLSTSKLLAMFTLSLGFAVKGSVQQRTWAFLICFFMDAAVVVFACAGCNHGSSRREVYQDYLSLHNSDSIRVHPSPCPIFRHCPYQGISTIDQFDSVEQLTGSPEGSDEYYFDINHFNHPEWTEQQCEDSIWRK
jgi:hypothetical protein